MAIRKMAILVAGHGGGDPGAVGQGTQEQIETIQIVDRVYNLLAPHPDILVERVPHSLDYVASTDWINSNYKNLDDGVIVEVHKNATVNAHGIETFTGIGPDAETKRLATLVNNGQVETTGLPNRGIKQGGFYLITYTNQRAVLTESGFISNGGDPVNDDFDAKYALGIANGICDFFGVKRPQTAPAPRPPVITTKDVMVTEVVPFIKQSLNSDDLPLGQSKVSQVGVNGLKTIVYTVTYRDGIEVSRVVKSITNKQPVNEITLHGTYVAPPVVPPVEPPYPHNGENGASWLERLVKWIKDMLSKFTYKG